MYQEQTFVDDVNFSNAIGYDSLLEKGQTTRTSLTGIESLSVPPKKTINKELVRIQEQVAPTTISGISALSVPKGNTTTFAQSVEKLVTTGGLAPAPKVLGTTQSGTSIVSEPQQRPISSGGGALVGGGGAIFGGGGGGGGAAPEDAAEETTQEQQAPKKTNLILIGLGGLALVYFLFLRKK